MIIAFLPVKEPKQNKIRKIPVLGSSIASAERSRSIGFLSNKSMEIELLTRFRIFTF